MISIRGSSPFSRRRVLPRVLFVLRECAWFNVSAEVLELLRPFVASLTVKKINPHEIVASMYHQ